MALTGLASTDKADALRPDWEASLFPNGQVARPLFILVQLLLQHAQVQYIPDVFLFDVAFQLMHR